MKLTTRNTYGLKDQKKANQANKYIGQGSPSSSTNQYSLDFGDMANCGQYTVEDTVFISAEGNRTGRLSPNLKEIDLAIAAGVTFITDNYADRHRTYNRGEREVANYLNQNSYQDNHSGIWTKRKDNMQQFHLSKATVSCFNIGEVADTLLKECLALDIPRGMGRRRIAQYGKDYTYSGTTVYGREIPEWLANTIEAINTKLGSSFNSVLINIYDKGINTGIGFHKDDEPELITQDVVSLSLGYSDDFIIKSSREELELNLEHGDVLVMPPEVQQHYLHGIPYKVMPETRVSLTFRQFN